MIQFLKSNARDFIGGALVFLVTIALFLLLGSRTVAESSILSTIASSLASLGLGVLRFVAACGLAWCGLAVTFPEANRTITSSVFDGWWSALPAATKCLISLAAAAVLVIAAALCLSA